MSDQRTDQSAALTGVLNGEYAAVYAYGLIGANLTGTAQARARKGLADHRQLRDDLRNTMVALGIAPPPPPAAYAPSTQVNSASSATALAISVEQRLVRAWSALASTSTGEGRLESARTAQECAVRAMSWGAASQAFPG